MEETQKDKDTGADGVYDKACRSLRENLDRLLEVSDEANGSPTRLKQVDLVTASGVARSTVAKLLARKSGSGANPDLRTLCRLAAALNIPPAFLLMSPEDWTRLAGAISGLQFTPAANAEGKPLHRCEPTEVATRAAALAAKIQPRRGREGLVDGQEPSDMDELREALEQVHRKTQHSVKAMSVAPNWPRVKGDIDSLFTICVLMGAATNV